MASLKIHSPWSFEGRVPSGLESAMGAQKLYQPLFGPPISEIELKVRKTARSPPNQMVM